MHTSRGFTLVELMVILVVVGVLIVLGGPSWLETLRNNRLATETNDLLSELAIARSESAKRGYRVSICASANGTTCSGVADDYRTARIIFEDRGVAGAIDGSDGIIRVGQALSSTTILTVSGFSNVGYFQYRPSGVADSAGTLRICDDRGAGNYGRILTVTSTGRAQLTSAVACP